MPDSLPACASLAAQLIEHDLIDEYRLMIEPVLLGGGRRVFPADARVRPLELVSTSTASTGVLICTYRPAPLIPARPPGEPAAQHLQRVESTTPSATSSDGRPGFPRRLQ